MTWPLVSAPPFEAIQNLLLQRKDRYRQLRASGREHECRILGADGAAAAGLGIATQATQQQQNGSIGTTPSQRSEGLVDRPLGEEVSKHAMLRMLATGYLLPLLAFNKDSELYAQRTVLLEASASEGRGAVEFGIFSALAFIVSSIEKDAKLLTHRFDLGDRSDPSQVVSVAIWLLPRILAAAASIQPETASTAGGREEMEKLRTELLNASLTISKHTCTVTATRKQVKQVLREMLSVSVQAFAAGGQPAFLQSSTSLHKIAEDLPAANEDGTVQVLQQGIDVEASTARKESDKSSVAFLWLPEDNLTFSLRFGTERAYAGRFARALLASLVAFLHPLSQFLSPYFSNLSDAATQLFLSNWELDLSTADALAKPSAGAHQAESTIVRLHAVHSLLSAVSGADIADLAGKALALAIAEVDTVCAAPAVNTSASSGALPSIWRAAITLLSEVSVRNCNNAHMQNTLEALVRPRLHHFGKIVREPIQDGLDKSQLEAVYLRKACAWQILVSSSRSEASVLSDCLAAVAQSTPDGEDLAPQWMPPSQVQQLPKLIKNLENNGVRLLVRKSLKRKRGAHTHQRDPVKPSATTQAEIPDLIAVLSDPFRDVPTFAEATLRVCRDAARTTDQQQPDWVRCEVCEAEYNGSEVRRIASVLSVARSLLDELAAATKEHISSKDRDLPSISSALVGFGRILSHSPDQFLSEMDSIALFEMLKQAMMLKSRSCRLAATEVVWAVAMRFDRMLSHQKLSDARHVLQCVNTLHSDLLASGDGRAVEAAIDSLGRVGRLKSDILLGPTILKLVETLEAGPFPRSAAYSQIVALSAYHHCTTFQLLFPHLEQVSVYVVSRMMAVPSLFIEVLRLTGMTKTKFLQATLQHIVPALIKSKSRVSLQSVAKALGSEEKKLCIDCMVPILNMCLIQEQRARKQCIQELSRYLDAAYFDQMLRSYLPEILGNLVINLGYEERRHNAFTGLNFVYETLKVKKEKRTFGEWLGAESMAIHAWLNDDLNSGHGRRTMAEKKAVVKSLSELIDIVGYFITSITPQIIATLTSNFANADLRHEVLKTWRKLISVLQASDLELYLGQTVASMSSFWDTMDEAEKDEAIGMINDLLSQPKDLKEKAETVLSQVRTSQSMREEVTALQQLKGNFAARATKRQQLTGLLKDLYNDSAAVLFQALGELQSFLFSERDFVKELASGNKFDPLAGSIISALLAILARMEAASSGDIAQLAFQCLGCVGAIDPDRLDIREDEPIRIILNNFKDQDEATDFALHLIKDVLVKAFRATDNTKHQANLAFAIQELLKFCGFSTALLDTAPMHNRAAPPVKTKARWQALPRHMLDTVAPLLESRYSIQFIDAPPRELPLSHHTNSYREWLQTWTSQLIKATQGTPAEPVFSVFRGVVLEHDLTVAQHILPHLVLTVLISGPQQRRDEVREEFLGVLTLQVVGRKDNNQRLMMAQTVFGLMDHLSVWLHRKRVEHAKQQRRSSTRSPREEISVIESVIDSIPQQLLATASFQSQSYARSLLHFEQTIRQYQGEVEPTGLQDQLEKMHCIYACLDEPDGMEGISTLVRSPSLEHQIREHESTGRWTAAQSCWELKLQQAPDEPKLHLGLLNCLRNLGHYDTMQTHIRGALSHNPDWQSLLGQFEVEGACILSQWGEVARLVDLPNATSDKHALARLLLAMRSGDQVAVLAALRDARQQLGRPIIAAGKTRYALIYDSVLQLQVIQDLETIFVHKEGTQDITALLSDRVAQTLPSFRVREVLLSAHRTALRSVMKDNKASVAAAWIQTSKFARRADHRQTSYSAVLQAARLDASFSFVQRAKLLRLDDQLQAAIQVMNNNLASFETPSSELAGYHASKSDIAKANLLRSSLMEATGRYSRNEVLESYRRTAKIDETAERPWYQLGHYADISRDTADGSAHVVDAKVVNYLLRALKYGIKYFFRTLPRILTIWLDAGENEVVVEANRAAQNAPGTGEDAAVTAFRDINSHIRKAHAWIPGYQWLAVFAQLVCRVTHRNDSVWKLLQDVIGKVIDEYPQQAMWAVVGGCQSKDLERRKRFKEIIHKVKAKASKRAEEQQRSAVSRSKVRSTESGFSVVKAIDQALLMALQLQLLCDHPVQQKVSVLSMAQEFPKIISLESDHLLLPLQSSLVVGLPANNISDRDHQPFPDNLPCIQRFDDVVEIMNSLQKPRKLTVLGTDGASYNFLCKPKDDLRKDARLMDFDAMINKLLQSNSDSRRRKLYIRTYAVVTLNEECGLIEWVPNTVGLRHILHKLYATRNIHLYGPDVKNAFEEQKANHKTAAMVFENKALAKYPPVFHEWFLATFPEPSAWLGARLRYARTLAVMSMVGHVLGLGDRHGENILFDSVSGDTVHVDLNCLFEKGLTFEIPERVPFRLTQNLVDALGVTGPDGVFRKAAEISMTILRDNKDSLMSVLEAMIHDPLVEWTPDLRYKNKNRHGGIDPRTLEARHALHTVRRKLEGYKKLSHSTSGEVSLSTPNLVDALIRDATSSHNLALMYIGWASYL